MYFGKKIKILTSICKEGRKRDGEGRDWLWAAIERHLGGASLMVGRGWHLLMFNRVGVEGGKGHGERPV